jgi:hypothetical protein
MSGPEIDTELDKMYQKLGFLLTLLLIFQGNMASASSQNPLWPTLPKTGFIAGRPATLQDVADGNAVFSAEKDGKVIGVPLPIEIPEYAYWDDGKGHKIPVIVIQAERANGLEVFGLRNPEGQYLACTGPELTLLGRTHP